MGDIIISTIVFVIVIFIGIVFCIREDIYVGKIGGFVYLSIALLFKAFKFLIKNPTKAPKFIYESNSKYTNSCKRCKKSSYKHWKEKNFSFCNLSEDEVAIGIYTLILLIFAYIFSFDVFGIKSTKDALKILEIVFAGLIGVIMLKITKKSTEEFKKQYEDSIKTTTFYTQLMNEVYSLDKELKNFYEFENKAKIRKCCDYCFISDINSVDPDAGLNPKQKFPIRVLAICEGKNIQVKDSLKVYSMPKLLIENRSELMKAHNHSTIKNNIMIRLDNITIDKEEILLETSRTKYFDFLIGNRAMDYEFSGKLTPRKCFAPGHLFPKLKESKFANLLGVNMMVVCKDKYNKEQVVFVKRSDKLSIEKGLLGNGVQGALKFKNLFDIGKHEIDDKERQGQISEKNIFIALAKELEDELGVVVDDFEKRNFLKTVYYDYVEGKPQLYCEVRLDERDKNSKLEDIKKNVEENEKIIGNYGPKTDGKKIVTIPLNEMSKVFVGPYGIIYKDTFYKMVPSASYPVAQFIESIKDKN